MNDLEKRLKALGVQRISAESIRPRITGGVVDRFEVYRTLIELLDKWATDGIKRDDAVQINLNSLSKADEKALTQYLTEDKERTHKLLIAAINNGFRRYIKENPKLKDKVYCSVDGDTVTLCSMESHRALQAFRRSKYQR